jgi:hypothetical protein
LLGWAGLACGAILAAGQLRIHAALAQLLELVVVKELHGQPGEGVGVDGRRSLKLHAALAAGGGAHQGGPHALSLERLQAGGEAAHSAATPCCWWRGGGERKAV